MSTVRMWHMPFAFVFLTEIQLIYNAVIFSGVYKRDSVINTYTSIFFWFFSLIGCYKILSRGPCAIQQVLGHYLFYLFLKLFIYSFSYSSALVACRLHSMWDLSSPTRDGPQVACIARRMLYHWPTRQVLQECVYVNPKLLIFSLVSFNN